MEETMDFLERPLFSNSWSWQWMAAKSYKVNHTSVLVSLLSAERCNQEKQAFEVVMLKENKVCFSTLSLFATLGKGNLHFCCTGPTVNNVWQIRIKLLISHLKISFFYDVNIFLLIWHFSFSRTYSSCLTHSIVTCMRLPVFKIFLKFVHFCPNFQIFCLFLPFFFFFLKNCTHALTFQNKPYLYYNKIHKK